MRMYIVQLALASDNTYSVTSTRPERTVTKIYITQPVEGKRSNRSDSFLFFFLFFILCSTMAFPLLSWIESLTLMSCNEMDFVSTLFDTHTSLNSDTGTNSLYENSRENRIETRKRIFYPEMLLECSWDCFND